MIEDALKKQKIMASGSLKCPRCGQEGGVVWRERSEKQEAIAPTYVGFHSDEKGVACDRCGTHQQNVEVR